MAALFVPFIKMLMGSLSRAKNVKVVSWRRCTRTVLQLLRFNSLESPDEKEKSIAAHGRLVGRLCVLGEGHGRCASGKGFEEGGIQAAEPDEPRRSPFNYRTQPSHRR